MAKIIIFGDGPLARLAHHYFTTDSEHEVAGFTVDNAYKTRNEFCGLELMEFETLSQECPPEEFSMFVAVGYSQMNRVRAEKRLQCLDKGYSLVSYISSHCTWLAQTPPGDNCFILEHNIVQPFATVGSGVILWNANVIAHEAVVEDHCFIASQVVVSGGARVGAYSFLGANSSVNDGIHIAEGTLVGAGAVISHDTAPNSVYVPPRSVCLEGKDSSMIDL